MPIPVYFFDSQEALDRFLAQCRASEISIRSSSSSSSSSVSSRPAPSRPLPNTKNSSGGYRKVKEEKRPPAAQTDYMSKNIKGKTSGSSGRSSGSSHGSISGGRGERRKKGERVSASKIQNAGFSSSSSSSSGFRPPSPIQPNPNNGGSGGYRKVKKEERPSAKQADYKPKTKKMKGKSSGGSGSGSGSSGGRGKGRNKGERVSDSKIQNADNTRGFSSSSFSSGSHPP